MTEAVIAEDLPVLAVSVAEAARLCGIGESTLWKLIKLGQGPPLVKIGCTRTLILVGDLMGWLRASRLGGDHDP